MRLVRGERVELGELVGFLVLGDGAHDEKVVEALLERFDHRKAVLAPQDKPALGLEWSLELAAYLVGRFGVDVLVVIDGDRFDRKLFSRLVEQYFSYREVEERGERFIGLRVARGGFSARLYVAVMGVRSIEEVEAALIHALYGEDVEPEKSAIRIFLRERGKKIYDLIREAGEDELRRAFSSELIELLKRWRRN